MSKPFNYEQDEDYNADYESLAFVKNKKALKERWRQQLKFNTLSGYDMLIDQQNGESKTDDDDDEAEVKEPVVKKSLKEIEEESRAETLKTLDNYFTD